MRLLLLLVSFVCQSNADYYDKDLEYGKEYKIRLSRWAESVEFLPRGGSTVTVLWHRLSPQASEDSRVKMSGYIFTRNQMMTRDSGVYTVKDQYKRIILEESVDVIATVETYVMKPEETFRLYSELDRKSCNIYFFPNHEKEIVLVRSGVEQSGFSLSPCSELEYMTPCSLVVLSLESTCTGRFEVRDDYDDAALVINLEVESTYSNPVYVGAACFIAVVIFLGCCCTRCCCGRSKSTNKASEPAAEPAAGYHTYDHEPVGPRQNQLSQPSTSHYSAQPSRATTGPLIHNPPVNVPPAYSQSPNASDTPLCSDAEPRFELKGMNLNLMSPLSSESAYSSVYTSDKLNFL